MQPFTIRSLVISDLEPNVQQHVTIKGGATVTLTHQRTGFGVKRLFTCPYCGRRCAKLLKIDGYVPIFCPVCIPINRYRHRRNLYDSGNDSLIRWHMRRLAEKNGMDIKIPFCLISHLDKCPPTMRFATYLRTLEKLHKLEKLRTVFSTYSIFRSRSPIGTPRRLSAAVIKDYMNYEGA